MIPLLKTDLPHVVNFSGGRTSAYLVSVFEDAKKKQPDLKVEYVFCDTGAEHPKTYAFIRKVVEYFGIELTCIRTHIPLEYGFGAVPVLISLDQCGQDLKPFLNVCEKHGTPTVAAPLCSDRMKGIPADKYCNEKYGRYEYYKWLGIRADEQQRLRHLSSQIDLFDAPKKEKMKFRYMAQISNFEKVDVLDYWASMPFDLHLNEVLGNCVFCIKKGENKLALAARYEPEMAQEFIKMIHSETVHKRPTRELPPEIMYRDHMSLEAIIKKWEIIPTIDIENQIKYGKQEAAGNCSESCEAFTLEAG